eukprot:Sspe_Gene.71219::Locus_42179_Transcript_1_1_Confidence_1.000_Length_1822::g.71219::m.71219
MRFLVAALLGVVLTGLVAEGFCATRLDCSLNGDCIGGRCVCNTPWKGDECEVLDVGRANLSRGYRSPHLGGKISSWGGSMLRWEKDGLYHLFAAEMVGTCGIEYWEPNSQVVHAVSNTPEGPYTFHEVVLPPFAHEPNAIRGPNGEFVIYLTYRHPDDYFVDCSTPAPVVPPSPPGPCGTPPRRDTYMIWSKSPYGPWSTPELVLSAPNTSRWGNCPVMVDSNLAGVILPNGSFVGMWRKCVNTATGECQADCCTFLHRAFASNWKDPESYTTGGPLFPGMQPYGSEDPFVYMDPTGGYHAILHDEQGTTRASARGRHACSADGVTWKYATVDAYNGNVSTTDGGNLLLSRRERPHLLIQNGVPTHLSNGVQEADAPVNCSQYPQCDRSYTLVVPLGSS